MPGESVDGSPSSSEPPPTRLQPVNASAAEAARARRVRRGRVGVVIPPWCGAGRAGGAGIADFPLTGRARQASETTTFLSTGASSRSATVAATSSRESSSHTRIRMVSPGKKIPPKVTP